MSVPIPMVSKRGKRVDKAVTHASGQPTKVHDTPHLLEVFERLSVAFGEQGWWPTTPDGELTPVHDPSLKYRVMTGRERFEIECGAILTQNAAWTNVEKALTNLHHEGIWAPEDILETPHDRLAELIRPAVYMNVKAKKLKALASYVLDPASPITREGFLSIWGIGKETADSIILYAYQKPSFVVDAYTRRILGRVGRLDPKWEYDIIQALFHEECPSDVLLYNEYHALIVDHAKRHCATKPKCAGCVLGDVCRGKV